MINSCLMSDNTSIQPDRKNKLSNLHYFLKLLFGKGPDTQNTKIAHPLSCFKHPIKFIERKSRKKPNKSTICARFYLFWVILSGTGVVDH